MNNLEYRMDKAMFKAILKDRKNSKEDPIAYVLKVINNEFGLKGTVTSISFYTN